MITYTGDEQAAAQFPHGNSKNPRAAPYQRTQAHVLHAMKSSTTSSAKNVYRSLVTPSDAADPTTSSHLPHPPVSTAVPRNSEQARNALKAQRNKSRPSRDALFNLHELAYDTTFVHHITTFPDLEVILYDRQMMHTFQSLLTTSSTDSVPTQVVSYDTTFNIGDFYLSVLLFRHTDFESAPVLPLAYMIHERKLQHTHEVLFQQIQSVCPQLGTATNIVIVTDNEPAIRNAIRTHFPDASLFLCWNHVLQDCKRWLRSHGVSTSVEMAYYTDSVRQLLQSASLDEYKNRLIEATTMWSQPFASQLCDRT